MRKSTLTILVIVVLAALTLGAAAFYPPLNERVAWRLDRGLTYLRGLFIPGGGVPAASAAGVPQPKQLPPPQALTTRQPQAPNSQAAAISSTSEPTLTPTLAATPTPTPSPTPLPQNVSLPAPAFEKQDINSCGPATLTMYLRYWGWEGVQADIASLVKPQRDDRNVNVEELAYYVSTKVGWLTYQYRVGGDLDRLKSLLAAGLPVMVEESFYFPETYWPNDDHWAAHYFLLTGYDEDNQTFTGQDSFYGADRKVTYDKLDSYWQSFNRVYILVYPQDKESAVKAVLGDDWDMDANRQHALEVAQAETERQPENAFAWFNLGTNLTYFERYADAADAFDQARNLGLPQRMLRYQFSPFIAYFHSGRNNDLLTLTDYALKRTRNSEEALLWKGWGLYRQGDLAGAIASFQQALVEQPNYGDAQYALNFVQSNP